MIKFVRFISPFLLFLIIRCAGTSQELKFLDEPNEAGVIIIGNVIIENINQQFSFQNWDFPVQVVILGKSDNGIINHHTITTDDLGYYCLPNVPAGQYALKAVIVPMFGSQPIKLVNDLTYNDSEFYRMRHPEEPIDYTAAWLPLRGKGRIVNFNIMWLGLREADVEDIAIKSIGKIMVVKSSEDLQNRRFYVNGYPYTREDPLTYFKKKFPEAGWWKL